MIHYHGGPMISTLAAIMICRDCPSDGIHLGSGGWGQKLASPGGSSAQKRSRPGAEGWLTDRDGATVGSVRRVRQSGRIWALAEHVQPVAATQREMQSARTGSVGAVGTHLFPHRCSHKNRAGPPRGGINSPKLFSARRLAQSPATSTTRIRSVSAVAFRSVCLS
jgi:hypothetical protein